jgi:hypothetical protein
MAPQDEQLRKIIDCIFVAHQDDQMDCEICNSQFECLAEKVAAGANLHDLWPEIEAHLSCCRDCSEEFQAIVCILRAELNGQLTMPQNEGKN